MVFKNVNEITCRLSENPTPASAHLHHHGAGGLHQLQAPSPPLWAPCTPATQPSRPGTREAPPHLVGLCRRTSGVLPFSPLPGAAHPWAHLLRTDPCRLRCGSRHSCFSGAELNALTVTTDVNVDRLVPFSQLPSASAFSSRSSRFPPNNTWQGGRRVGRARSMMPGRGGADTGVERLRREWRVQRNVSTQLSTFINSPPCVLTGHRTGQSSS